MSKTNKNWIKMFKEYVEIETTLMFCFNLLTVGWSGIGNLEIYAMSSYD